MITSQLKTSASFSIATFNAGLLKVKIAGVTVFEFTPHTTERLLALPNALAHLDCDVICLQEVYDEGSAERIRQALESTYPYSFRQPTRRPVLVGNGLMIVSRFELTETHLHVFRAQTVDEALAAPRAMMRATMTVPGLGIIGIYNVHLTAGGSFHHPEALKSDEIRTRQVEELIGHANRDDLDMTLLTGDFNCGSRISSGPYSRMPEAGYTDIPALVKGAQIDSWITWDPANPLNQNCPHKTSPPQRIDHIFIETKAMKHLCSMDANLILNQPQVPITGGDPVTLSDHAGVMVHFHCSSAT